MVKKSLLWVYRITAWLLGIVIVVVLISAITIQFLVLPNINQYKDKIAEIASHSANQKVVIGNIKAGWQGVNPHFTLSNIDIYDAQNRPALQLNNTEVALSWLSIPLFEPRLAELTIRAPELTIRRVASGEVFVAGISMSGESKPDLSNWLLRQSKVAVLDAKVIWLDEMLKAPALKSATESDSSPALTLDKLNLNIYSPPWKSLIKYHHITLDTIPSVGTHHPIMLTGDVYGNDVSQADEWRGDLTLQVKNANIAAWKPWLSVFPMFDAFTSGQPVELQSGIASTKTIINFANRQVKSVKSEIALNQVQVQIKDQIEPIVLTKLNGQFNWKNLSVTQAISFNKITTGNAFTIKDLTVVTNNGLNLQNASASYLDTTGKDKPRHQTLNLALTHINLASLKPFLAQLPLPVNVSQHISGLSPTGNLDDFVLKWEGNPASTTSYQLNTKFSGLSIKSHAKIPGFSNLTGVIKADQKTGKLTLASQNAKLDFKEILRWPIPADKLAGDIRWDIADQNNITKKTTIKVSNLSISSPHLSGTVNANYTMDSIKGDTIDLIGKFNRVDAKYALFYYPTILGKDTLHWLDTSIQGGRIDDIRLIVKGRLADFPFVDRNNHLDNKLGLFRVTAKLSNSLLEYGTGWPRIEGLGINLLFEGKRMELNSTAGHILGNQIVKSKTTIAQLDADDPILNVVGELKGPVVEGIKFVNNSPVRELTQGFTDDLKTSGLGNLSLGLKIPLNDIDRAQYKGAYLITNGVMQSDDIPALSRINGLLEFTENSFSAKNIKASAYGAPLIFNLASGKDKVIRIAAKGKLTDDALKQIFTTQNMSKGANYISGSADWLGDITIQKPQVTISVRSDLIGITSHLPAPFTKAASDRWNLLIDKKQDDTTNTITLSLGNKLAAKISHSIENGKLLLNRTTIRLNAEATNSGISNAGELNTNTDTKLKGIQVFGNLDYLDGDAWRNVMADFSNASKPDTENLEPSLPIQKIALKINTLDIFDRRINQLKISNKSDKDGLRANIQSREISGDLQWLNQNNGKLIAHLTHLSIPDASPPRMTAATSNTTDANTNVSVKLNQIYPALDITADSFEFNKKKLGALTLVAFPQEDNWNIQKFKLSNPESTLNADGVWNKWVRNPNTRFNINWDIQNLGKTLARFGYPDTIKGGSGELTGQLSWAGSPHEFDTIALNGNLQFDVRKGEILKVQPGVGRLLGLISLQSLPRRLSLDFRDLFSNGFAFDKISATVKIDRGVMRSDNFSMTGPAADVTIKGETNLQKETQQLFVKVMPHISDSISLAALAGGPLVGAVAFLAQKILKDPLNKIVSTEYEIGGTWDNPHEVKSPDSNQESSGGSPLN
ncbi:MAG TPA: YhdP family protein [Methylotenera sp.]|nr:YhdP family protein [Methylotenera sp.]